MGRSIYQRRNKTLKEVMKILPMGIDPYTGMEIARTTLNLYILNGKHKECECGEIISPRSKSGVCRKCYRNRWRKKPEAKVKDALRAKKYRRNIKVKLWGN